MDDGKFEFVYHLIIWIVWQCNSSLSGSINRWINREWRRFSLNNKQRKKGSKRIQTLHYTHKQSLARIPPFDYREIIYALWQKLIPLVERDLPFPIPVTLPQVIDVTFYKKWDSLPVDDYSRIIESKTWKRKNKMAIILTTQNRQRNC